MPRRRRALASPVTDIATSKPVLDNQRIATVASADFSPANLTIGCFFRAGGMDTRGTIWRAFNAAVGGSILRLDSATQVLAFVVMNDGNNQGVTITVPGTLLDGEWHWVAMWSDGSTINVQVDDESVASAGMAFPLSLVAGLAPTLFDHETGAAGHSLQGEIADFRFYDSVLTTAELREWRQSGGATLQSEGSLVARPTVVERGGAVDMTDAADATRVWTEAGVGTALTVAASASESRAV